MRNAAVYDAQGRLFASWRAAAATQPPPTLQQAGAVDPEVPALHDLVVRAPIVDQGRTIGTVYVRARDELDERIASYGLLALALILLALAATWAVSSWLQAIVTLSLIHI